MRRRGLLVAGGGALALAGCGFRLREAPRFAFTSLHLAATSPVAQELRRNLESTGAVQVLDARVPPHQAQVVLDVRNEQRQKIVVGRNASGQVREFQLRTTLKFRLRSARGLELIPETELSQQRDISFNEAAALSKETEEALMYRDMQTDLVQQLIRRLAAVKDL